MSHPLFDFEEETMPHQAGILLADHFVKPYGYVGHRPNGAKDWLLIYTVSGEGHYRVYENVERCVRGDVVILPPEIPHHYATPLGKEWELMWVHFLPLPDWHRWLQIPRTEEGIIHVPIYDEDVRTRMEEAFTRLNHDLRDERGGMPLALISLSEVLALLHQQVDRLQGDTLDPRIETVLRYLAEHLAEPQSIPELADLVELSVSRLCHLFKEQMDMTIMEKLNRMRLEKAARLLVVTPWKVQDIAEEVGYESAYYFTRRFTKLYGKSPSAFRKSAVDL